MCLFLEAAIVWSELQKTTYQIIIGYKNKSETINLSFRQVDFDHMAGMQYSNDVDFKLPRKKYRGENLVPSLIDGKLNPCLIEKGRNWADKISYRLQGIKQLGEIIESNFSIYEFNPRKLNFYSEIQADYLIYNEKEHRGFFLFLDESDDTYYCKSIFHDDVRNYCLNQTRWVVLKKTKKHNGSDTVLFTHPNYKE